MLSFLYPTPDQMKSYLSTLVKVGGGFLAGKGYAISPDLAALFTGPEAIQFYSGIAMFVVPMIRDRLIHSPAGILASAGALAAGPNPVIKTIETLPTAPPEIKAVADSTSVPGVQPATPEPFVTSTIKNRGF